MPHRLGPLSVEMGVPYPNRILLPRQIDARLAGTVPGVAVHWLVSRAPLARPGLKHTLT